LNRIKALAYSAPVGVLILRCRSGGAGSDDRFCFEANPLCALADVHSQINLTLLSLSFRQRRRSPLAFQRFSRFTVAA
jgi:hypothetical protein